jgi:hypothetical protein
MRSGMTDQEAADAMNTDGRWRVVSPSRAGSAPRAFTRNSVSVIRRNRFYRPYAPGDERGTVMHNGAEYRGVHAPACSWDEWSALQEVASGRRRGWTGYAAGLRPEPHTAEFRGLAVCSECGGRLYVWRTVHETRDGRKRVYERYVCTARDRGVECGADRKWARVEDVRAAWVAWLEAHPMPPDWEAQLRAYAMHAESAGSDTADRDQAARDQARWERKRAAARSLYLEGELSQAEWDARREEADAALASLAAASQGAGQYAIRLMDAAALIVQLSTVWERATTQERQQMAALMIEPRGLRLRLYGAKARTSKWQTDAERPPSCDVDGVALRVPFRELYGAVAASLAG